MQQTISQIVDNNKNIVDPDEFIIGFDSDDEGVEEHQENHSDESDSEADSDASSQTIDPSHPFIDTNLDKMEWEKSPYQTIPTPAPSNEKTTFTTGLEEDCSILDAFRLFFDDDMILSIVIETNAYAKEIKIKKPNAMRDWKPLSDEFGIFTALHILMGVIHKA